MIPAFLIRAAAGWVGQRFARPLAGAILLAALVLAALLAKVAYDRSIVADHMAGEDARTAITNSAAHNEAADQRARDSIRISEDERKRDEAIVSAPSGLPSHAAVRLNCERLRQAGYDTDSHAACR